MAEIGTLGDIVFKVSANKVRTFDDLKIDSKTNYAKHTRHLKKPLLEFQYNDSDTATAVNTKGTHPYHCISQDGKGVYGWVNAADVK